MIGVLSELERSLISEPIPRRGAGRAAPRAFSGGRIRLDPGCECVRRAHLSDLALQLSIAGLADSDTANQTKQYLGP